MNSDQYVEYADEKSDTTQDRILLLGATSSSVPSLATTKQLEMTEFLYLFLLLKRAACRRNTKLYSSLWPYAMTMSEKFFVTADAAAFIRRRARESFGFRKECILQNFVKPRPSRRTTNQQPGRSRSSSSNFFTYSNREQAMMFSSSRNAFRRASCRRNVDNIVEGAGQRRFVYCIMIFRAPNGTWHIQRTQSR